jgi:hypothetical protein
LTVFAYLLATGFFLGWIFIQATVHPALLCSIAILCGIVSCLWGRARLMRESRNLEGGLDQPSPAAGRLLPPHKVEMLVWVLVGASIVFNLDLLLAAGIGYLAGNFHP